MGLESGKAIKNCHNYFTYASRCGRMILYVFEKLVFLIALALYKGLGEWKIHSLYLYFDFLGKEECKMVVEKVEKLMLPICQTTGTYLVDVRYEEENETWYLRIFIDTDEGLTMEECVTVTEFMSAKLDEEDFISEEYMLEVSSPGAERPLKTPQDLKDAVGCHVNVVVKEAIDDISEFQGDLIAFESNILLLECLFKTRKRKIEIDYSHVKKARLAVKF